MDAGDPVTSDPREQPIAPKPEWDAPAPHKQFNRERFLLRIVAAIIGVQFGVFILAAVVCAYGYTVKLGKVTSVEDRPEVCPKVFDDIKAAAGDGLAVLLALLGGGTLAVGEYQRRRPQSQASLPEPTPPDIPPPRPLPPVMPPPPPADPRSGAPLDPRDPRNRPPEDEPPLVGPPLVGPRQGR